VLRTGVVVVDARIKLGVATPTVPSRRIAY
jgi:hypothetical protein